MTKLDAELFPDYDGASKRKKKRGSERRHKRKKGKRGIQLSVSDDSSIRAAKRIKRDCESNGHVESAVDRDALLFMEFNGTTTSSRQENGGRAVSEEGEEEEKLSSSNCYEIVGESSYPELDSLYQEQKSTEQAVFEGELQDPLADSLELLKEVDQNAEIWIFNSATARTTPLTPRMHKLLDSNQILPLKKVLGLYTAKKLLEMDILLPIKKPKLYGYFKPPRMLCIYGREGSGKSTLALSFCREHQINVISVSETYTTHNWIETLIRASCAIRPCVILFNNCDYHFGRENETRWAQHSLHFIKQILDKNEIKDVWVVLNTTNLPMTLHPYINSCLYKHCAYAEPPRDMEDDDADDSGDEQQEVEKEQQMDKTLMFERIFEEGWGKDVNGQTRWKGDVYGTFLMKVLTDYSDAVNFKDVRDFADELFTERLRELGLQADLELEENDVRLMPSKEKLEDRLRLMSMANVRRFTRHNPAEIEKMYQSQESSL